MSKVLITGATGMIGQLVLKHCLESDQIDKVIALGRTATQNQHTKLSEVLITDFTNYSEVAHHFKNVDAAFFCLGVYTGNVKDDLFKKITVDFAVQFATTLKNQSPNARLCLLSGAGADRTEKSRTSFARYKGMAENQISALGLEFYAFRPGYIYPVKKRKEPNFMYKLSRFLYPVLKLFGKNLSIKSTALAKAMFKVGLVGAKNEIIENADILAID